VTPARRNEDDGCQLVEEAVTARALSTRSCTKRPTSARVPRNTDQLHDEVAGGRCRDETLVHGNQWKE
jgi:hypothetical protein